MKRTAEQQGTQAVGGKLAWAKALLHPTRRVLLILLIVAVAVACGAGAVYLYSNRDKNYGGFRSSEEQKVFQTTQDLDKKAFEGNNSEALKGYDSAINETDDSNSKRNLLLSKAAAAMAAKQYDDALRAAQQADTIKSDHNSLGFIATIYDQMGDKAKAIDYYKRAATFKSEFNFESKRYELRAQELQSELEKQ